MEQTPSEKIKARHQEWLNKTNRKCAEFMWGIYQDPDRRSGLWTTDKELTRVLNYIKQHYPEAFSSAS